MRRRTKRDLLRSNKLALILSGFFLILGIFLPFLPYVTPETQPEDFITTTVVVERLKRVYPRKGSIYTRLFATDGSAYTISHKYPYKELKETLQPGTVAEVTYTEFRFLWYRSRNARVIVVDGKQILNHNADEETGSLWPLYAVAAGSELAGLLCLAPVAFEIKEWQRQEKKRDARIAKKHGKKPE